MKIQLTNEEFYEIKMPEQIGINEFRSIVNKFNFLLKNFSKFDIGNEKPDGDIILNEEQVRTYKKRNKNKWNILRDNRDIFLDMLNIHYHKSTEELLAFFIKYGINDFTKKEMSSTQVIRLRELHKINPNELGLTQFPTITKSINEVRIRTGEQNE